MFIEFDLIKIYAYVCNIVFGGENKPSDVQEHTRNVCDTASDEARV